MSIRWITPFAAAVACLLSLAALGVNFGEERGTVILRVLSLEELGVDHEHRLRSLEDRGRIIEGLVVEVRATRRDVERIRNMLEGKVTP